MKVVRRPSHPEQVRSRRRHTHEHGLDQVRRLVGAPCQRDAMPKERLGVCIVEVAQRPGIARRQPAQQLTVGVVVAVLSHFQCIR